MFFEEDCEPLDQNLNLILKFLVTGYNLLEPEYSHEFPLVKFEILLPQIFNSPSILLLDPHINHVFFNEETNFDRI